MLNEFGSFSFDMIDWLIDLYYFFGFVLSVHIIFFYAESIW